MVQSNFRADPATTSAPPGDEGVTDFLRLDFVTHPPDWGRPFSSFIIMAVMMLVALADFSTGPHLSMRVFYDLPVVLAVVWLDGWAGVATCAACALSLYGVGRVENAEFAQSPQVYWNLPVAFALYLVVAWILHAFVRLRRELEQRVLQRTAALQRSAVVLGELQRELFLAGSHERMAIGQDLHDGLCQHLVGTAFAAQVLAGDLATRGEHGPKAKADHIVHLIEEGVRQTRQLARGLLLNSIGPAGLATELEEYAATVGQQRGVPCCFVARGRPEVSDEQTALHLFHIAQEAVTNAVRHAHPRTVEIALTTDDTHMVLIVSDDGTGIPTHRPGAGAGLRLMEHRADVIGGELTVERADTGGTIVRCRVPVRGMTA
ncbi:MAG: sensor histidine kinase [Verrucomicrobiota bacterium]